MTFAHGKRSGSYARLTRSSSNARLAKQLLSGGGRGPSGGGGGGGPAWGKAPWIALATFAWAAVFLLLRLQSHMRWVAQHPTHKLPGGRECVGWKQTYFCHPFAERYGGGDKGCDEEIIPQVSGYCLCEGGVTTARVTCGPKSFTCRQKCYELALNPTDAMVLPTPISCPYEVPYLLSDYLRGMLPPPESWAIDAKAERDKASPVWDALWAAVRKHDLSDARAPAVRNSTHDFVREGTRVPPETVARVTRQVDGFKASAPPYPRSAFRGRGVVVVGGGLKYLVPAWVGVHQLRRSGCALPIEMWFPVAEAPNDDVVAALRQLGVTCRLLDFKGLAVFDPYEKPHQQQQRDANAADGSHDAAKAAQQRQWQQLQLQRWRKAAQQPLATAQQQQLLDELARSAPGVSERPGSGGSSSSSTRRRKDGSGSSSGGGGSSTSDGGERPPGANGANGDGDNEAGAAEDAAAAAAAAAAAEAAEAEAAAAAAAAPPGDPEHMARFTIKVAALLMSSFEEVLYLDADNIPLRDPSYLFDSAEYNNTGTLLWQDYWDNTVAPEMEEMLSLPRSRWYAGSFESGQMLVDKRRHWKGLALSAYFNANAAFFYEMFTCFLGKGDKETFAYGMLAAGEDIAVVEAPPKALGTVGTSMSCSPRTLLCRDEFTGNTMAQSDPVGRLLFLHSNLHKWDMRLPEKFSLHYQRRWVRLEPGAIEFEPLATRLLGYDPEHRAYELIRHLKCQPWWDEYYEAQLAKGDRETPPLGGFHYLLRGIELDRLYQHGWDGNYVATLGRIKLGDRLSHWWWGRVRPTLVRWGWAQHRW